MCKRPKQHWENSNERECGLIKMSAYGNVDWMLLMFDLACRELQNPLGERMLFHGFLCRAASPTLREPCWALNPACTLAVAVGREHKLIWFVFQVETGIIHTKDWKQRFGAAVKTVLLLISTGANTAVLLHLSCLQASLLVHFLADPIVKPSATIAPSTHL